jgi:hypothetical protein
VDGGRLKSRPPSQIRWPRPALERDRYPQVGGRLDSQLVVPSPDVLHERVSSDDHRGAAVLPEPTHQSQSRLEAAVVALDAVVGVPLGAMPGRREQLVQHRRVCRRLVGDDLDRTTAVVPIARSKNRRAAFASRRTGTNTSMTARTDRSRGRRSATGQPPSRRSRQLASGHQQHAGRAGQPRPVAG